jgi:hypothetical protein
MNSFHSLRLSLNVSVFALALGCGAFVHAGDQATPAEVVVPKAVFVDNPQVGKDPFFPESKRRLESLPRIASVTNVVAPSNHLLEQVFLKGISGTKEQRLALISSLINSATVAVGESAELRVGPQVLKLRCREIRERSIIVELDGSSETKEIKLREGV